MYPHFTDEETELAPSHMAGKWQSWLEPQLQAPCFFCCTVFKAYEERYEVTDQKWEF